MNGKFCNLDPKKIFFFILSLFIFVLTVFVAVKIQNEIRIGRYIGQDIELKNTISITETGEVFAKPDLGIISFSVTNEAKTVDQAMTENTEKMNKVIEAVKDNGVEKKDIKTINFSIYPRYEWERSEIMIYSPSGERYLAGYEITQTIQVKIRDLAKIGDIVQAAADAGANQVGSLSFTIDDEDEVKKEAREQAIDKAKEKAREITRGLGVNLGKVVSFTESGYYPYYPVYDYAESAVAIGKGEETPQIEAGENRITVTVTVTYEIN